MKTFFKSALFISLFCGAFLLLPSGGNKCHAQSALDALRSYGITPNVPPVSDPVCVYCGANRSNSPRREPHKKGYPCYEGDQNTSGQNQNFQPYTGSNNYNANTTGDHRIVTYNQPQTVYVPPKPIRETPEGQAMLQVAEAAGYAVGTLIAEGLFALGKKIFHGSSEKSDRHNYHNPNPDKQWGIWGIREQGGKEGIWDNMNGNWQIKPGKYTEIRMVDLNGSPMKSVKTGKWGIVSINDKGGKEIMPCEFDDVISYGAKYPGSPMALAVVDDEGYTHWIIGKVRQKEPWDFVVWEGEYSNVELAFTPDPLSEFDDVAIIAKEYKTGKSKILNYYGKTMFGGREEEKYDDIILTGMIEVNDKTFKDLNGRDVTMWDDYYKVKNNGKMGYVVTQHTSFADHSYGSYELLECEYDNITPLETQSYVYETMHNQYSSRSSKDLVITEKNGKFGIGYTFMTDVKEPKYDDVGIVNIRDADGDLMPVAITKEGNKYTARRLDGIPMYWDDGSEVQANDFLKVIDRLNKHAKACPHAWRKLKNKK